MVTSLHVLDVMITLGDPTPCWDVSCPSVSDHVLVSFSRHPSSKTGEHGVTSLKPVAKPCWTFSDLNGVLSTDLAILH